MEFFAALFAVMVIGATESLFGAQLIVWGLAQYHIHSGIMGPWLILSALTMLFGITSSASKS